AGHQAPARAAQGGRSVVVGRPLVRQRTANPALARNTPAPTGRPKPGKTLGKRGVRAVDGGPLLCRGEAGPLGAVADHPAVAGGAEAAHPLGQLAQQVAGARVLHEPLVLLLRDGGGHVDVGVVVLSLGRSLTPSPVGCGPRWSSRRGRGSRRAPCWRPRAGSPRRWGAAGSRAGAAPEGPGDAGVSPPARG